MGTLRKLVILVVILATGYIARSQTIGIISSGGSTALPPYRYFIQRGANFFFSPTAKTITNYTGLIGDPSVAVVSATDDSTGWTVSTIGPDSTLWNPDPLLGNVSATANGMTNTSPVDPWGYQEFDSAALTTGFVNYNSQYVPGTYNVKISGLNPDKLYQLKVTGSFTQTDSTAVNVYDSRTQYYFPNGMNHSLNTNYTTSKYIVGDTLAPNSSGELFFSVTGPDSTNSEGSIGVLSAMHISELSKDTGKGTTDLYRYYYDTVYVSDGTRERLCVIYKPYDFDPAKSYPMLLYIGGGESAIKDFNSFDPEVSTMDGIGTSLQHYKGAIYGRRADGDTGSFIICIPQYTLNEFVDTAEMRNLIANFKTRESATYNFNDTLFLGGFSRGAVSVLNYLIYHPQQVTAAYIASAVSGVSGTIWPSYTAMADTIKKFPEYGTKVWVVERGADFPSGLAYADSLHEYLQLYAPDNYYYTYVDREHSGFAWEWTMDTTNNILYHQNPYDWYYNPTRNHVQMAFFQFNNNVASTLPPFYTTMPTNPQYGVRTATDDSTGWTLSSVKTSAWGLSGNTTYSYSNLYQYPQYVYHELYRNGWRSNKSGGYATNGYNLEFSNLDPNESYTVYYGCAGATATDIGVMTWGAEETTAYPFTPIFYRQQPIAMTGTSDANGKIQLGFYPSASGSGTAYLNYIFIRKN